MTRIKSKAKAKAKNRGWEDPIVAEIREIREVHALKFKHDLDAIFLDLKAYEKSLKENAGKRSTGKKTA